MFIVFAKSICLRSLFCVSCLFRVTKLFYTVSLTTMFKNFVSLRLLEAKKRLSEVGLGPICQGHDTGSRRTGGWSSTLELPSTRPIIF